MKTLIKFSASKYSPHKFYNDLKSQGFKVAKDTVYNYIHYIEDAFLAFTISMYSESLRKMQINPKKTYVVDNRLANAYVINSTKNYGKIFENQIYLDLRRQGHQIFYYKTQDNYEIDFFTKDPQGKLNLYQVVWNADDQQTLERKSRALEAAESELGIKGVMIDPLYYLKMVSSEAWF